MKNKLNVNIKVQRNSEMLFHHIDEEIVMLDSEKGRYYGLNSIGSRIWALVENPVEIAGLISILVDEFDVDFDRCKIDVMSFLEELYEKKLISIIN